MKENRDGFSGSITCRTVSEFYRFVCPDSQACFRKRFLHTRKTMLPNKGTKVTISAHNNLLTELTFRLISKTNATHHRITMPIMNSCQRPNIEVENWDLMFVQVQEKVAHTE
jgi:hypothetical protein